ncbi:MAG: cytoplasmic protein [Deltaproteobacteria bacterium]|nr:cytoplasmic protein [Deltaproteobacteria bacterium]
MAKQPSFQQLEASLLYCPQCRQAMPVRKKLLLILPEGNKFEYLCTACSSTCGDKIEPGDPRSRLLM